MNIIWSPREIENRSMEIVDSYFSGYQFLPLEEAVVKRVVHSTGDPSLIDKILFNPRGIEDGLKALQNGANIYTDINMIKTGINDKKIDIYGGEVRCLVSEPEVANMAEKWGITRAAAAMYALGERLEGEIITIGNSPTALFAVLELIRNLKVRPSLVVGVPVGFVGAAESKEELSKLEDQPYVTLTGTRGGTPVAVAIINAMLNFN